MITTCFHVARERWDRSRASEAFLGVVHLLAKSIARLDLRPQKV